RSNHNSIDPLFLKHQNIWFNPFVPVVRAANNNAVSELAPPVFDRSRHFPVKWIRNVRDEQAERIGMLSGQSRSDDAWLVMKPLHYGKNFAPSLLAYFPFCIDHLGYGRYRHASLAGYIVNSRFHAFSSLTPFVLFSLLCLENGIIGNYYRIKLCWQPANYLDHCKIANT